MRRIYTYRLAVITSFVVAIAGAGLPQVVRAESENSGQGKAVSSMRRAEAKERLSDARLKTCQSREGKIKNIMSRIADRGQKQLDLFTSIAERTEKFYVDKGRMVSNYDALVAEVNTKKADAQTAVDAIKADSAAFVCTADGPKSIVTAFQGNLKTEIQALKAYKTAVKNLIVAVKSAQSVAEPSTNEEQQ